MQESGPLYSEEKNKGCGWKLPTGANCNISGPGQGKKRRTTPLLIKRREAFSDWTVGEKEEERERIEVKKTKRQTLRLEGMDWKDTQRDTVEQWVEC